MADDFRGNSVNPTFGTKEQLEYARRMAAYLRSKDNRYHMTPGAAVLPYSWVNAIGPNFIDQLGSNDYERIAGQGDLQIRNQAQGLPSQTMPPTAGDSISALGKKLFGGFKSSKVITPGTEPKDLTTGSIPPTENPWKATVTGPEGETIDTSAPKIKQGINRSSFDPELQERPELIKRLASMVKGEVGLGPGTSTEKQRIQLESAFNRSQIRGHSLDQGLLTVAQDPKKGYYASDTYNRGGPYGERLSPEELSWFKKNVYDPVINGSDHSTEFLGSPVTGNASEGNSNFASKRAAQGLYAKNKWWDNNKGEMFVTEKSDADKLAENPNLLPKHPSQSPALAGQMNAGATGLPPTGPGAPNAMPPGGPVPPPDPAADEAAKGMAPPQQMAQAFGTQPPANNAPPNANPNPPLLRPKSPSQLDAQVRSVPLDEIGKVIEQHRQELRGEDIKNPLGATRAQPGQNGAPNTYTNMPNQTPPISIGGMNLHMIPDGKGGFKLILPTGEDATLENLKKRGAELDLIGKNVEDIGATQRGPINTAIEMGATAKKQAQTLGAMETLVRSSPDLSMGPTSGAFNQIKRGLSNFFPGLAKDIDAADSVEKLNSLLASESTKGISANRGTNFELQTFMRANPNLIQSKEGMLMMIDILKQEKIQQHELGVIANTYRNRDPKTWQLEQEQYYNKNPIIIHRPVLDEKGKPTGETQNITTKPINSKSERDELPEGMGYIRPDGSVGTRPRVP